MAISNKSERDIQNLLLQGFALKQCLGVQKTKLQTGICAIAPSAKSVTFTINNIWTEKGGSQFGKPLPLCPVDYSTMNYPANIAIVPLYLSNAIILMVNC
jgi:hypothetical protein